MGRNKKKPSQTGRRRESAAAKRKARAFYRQRHRSCGGDVLPKDEAEGLAPWRGAEVVLMVVAATAVIGWIAAQMFS